MTLLAQILDKIDIYILHILKIINEQIIGRITHFLINLKKRYQNLMNFVGYINKFITIYHNNIMIIKYNVIKYKNIDEGLVKIYKLLIFVFLLRITLFD